MMRATPLVRRAIVLVGAGTFAVSSVWVGIRAAEQRASNPASGGSAQTSVAATDAVARGQYLVNAAMCHDCHTPAKMGPDGPEPDMTRMLSGHPASLTLPPLPALNDHWLGSFSASMTAWAGPWGISYTANLTPDPETGLGQWTEQQFVDALRTGRHQGRGREILPPMPWKMIRNFDDADLKAMFAYLRTVPPVRNRVPDPVFATPSTTTAHP